MQIVARMERMGSLAVFLSAIFVLTYGDKCPDNRDCPGACCPSGPNQYYCCNRPDEQDRVYLVGISSWWKDYWGVIIGCLIASILLSVICSVLCCLYCNGCLWHRRRNPDMYAGAFPLGTIIYSPYVGPHPAQPPYYEDSDSSVRSGASLGGRKGVRFDNDTMVKTFDAPKPALKKSAPPHANGNLLL